MKDQGLGYALAFVTVGLWAGFMVVSRVGGITPLNPYDITALRIATAAMVLAPWWLPRLYDPATRLLSIPQAVTFASLAGLGYPLLAYSGFSLAPASHGAVLISGLLPFFTTIFAYLMLAERPTDSRWASLILIGIGVFVLLRWQSVGGVDEHQFVGDLLFVAASVVWSLFGVLLKRWQVRAFEVTLAVVCIGTIVYLPIYGVLLPKNIGAATMGEIAGQAFFQGVCIVCLALWTYTKATSLIGATKMAMMLSSVPAVGVMLGVALLDEPLTQALLVGVLLTTLGASVGATSGSSLAAKYASIKRRKFW